MYILHAVCISAAAAAGVTRIISTATHQEKHVSEAEPHLLPQLLEQL
jgi:hypothetical protein